MDLCFFICNLFFILIYKYGCWYWNFDFICSCSTNYDYFSSLFNEKLTFKKIYWNHYSFLRDLYIFYIQKMILQYHIFTPFDVFISNWLGNFSVLAKKSNNATLNAKTDSFVKAFIFTIFFCYFLSFFF